MKKWIQIWYSWGDQEHPVLVPDEVDPWEYLKQLVINEVDVYQEENPYGCGVWMHPDDQMAELKYFGDNTYCYYLITDHPEYTIDNNGGG